MSLASVLALCMAADASPLCPFVRLSMFVTHPDWLVILECCLAASHVCISRLEVKTLFLKLAPDTVRGACAERSQLAGVPTVGIGL